jgi:LacI family transcriptional regulator
VSPKSREKVLKVIEELGYKPNVYASMLASQKKRTICCVIPEYVEGDFWSLTAKGIVEAGETAARYGINVEVVTYDQYEIESFQQACHQVLDMNPSGVVLAPIFRADTLLFAGVLAGRDIPYVYIDSRIEEDGNYLAYFGMPMFQSGYLCADILMNGQPAENVYVVRIERDRNRQSDPTGARRAGFMKYMAERFPDTRVTNVFIDPKNEANRFARLDEAFAGDDSRKLIVMFNSRVHLVAAYLRDRGISDCRVVGFDFLEKNVAALKEGIVQTIIAQHSDRQAASAVLALVDRFLLGNDVARRDSFTQMDILNSINCDYYM